MSADVSELIAFRDKLEGIQRQKDVVVSAIAKELTARLLRKVKKRTPVKTGTLRRGWTTGNTYNGDSYVVVMVNNNTYYASYVENGHRKRNKKGCMPIIMRWSMPPESWCGYFSRTSSPFRIRI